MHKQILYIVLATLGALTLSCSNNTSDNELQNLTHYVDPFIGSGGHGHVFVGANVPFGAVQLGPIQLSKGWDWCSGYHYSDSTIIGFAHTHLSGTGSSDLGDISFMPAIGKVSLSRGSLEDPDSGIYSFFSHNNEEAKAGYYSVHLDRYNIDVELTATLRVGFHSYTFPESGDAKIIIDLENGLGDKATEVWLKQENDTVISGYRTSSGWARNHCVYFTAVFSKTIDSFETSAGLDSPENGDRAKSNNYGIIRFSTEKNETVLVKVAISPVSIENAKLNMEDELPGWNFKQTANKATEAWNKELNKIVISSDSKEILRTFYTGLYHTMVAPSVHCDVNGEYIGADGKIYSDKDFTNYTTLSLWDTYRTAHPLINLIHPEMVPDLVATFLNIYKQQGKLPIWHLVSNETYAMVGNPGVIALADMVLKYPETGINEAYEAMKASSLLDERGMQWLDKYGYIPNDKEYSSVAKALEYGISDWSVAEVARKLGFEEEYKYFSERSGSYKHYFDPETKLLRPLDSNKVFKNPFDPISLSDYREGNAWQYTWLVPHDVNGLINLFGSEEAFTNQLDSLFTVNIEVKNALDVTGLLGQYAHGNEPGHHTLYLYSYVGQPWKTAEKVREVLNELYNDEPDGLSGNEDVGQMSAWYIMSALGFYPVNPASGDYVFGSPIVDSAILKLKDDKELSIIVKNNSLTNIYIQDISLNGEYYGRSFIKYEDIKNGGKIVINMGSNPSPTFGAAIDMRPSSKY